MELIDVVRKLVGPINPIGETNEDEKRFENLKVMTSLVDNLLSDIDFVNSSNTNRPEFSRNRAGKFADKFFDQIGIKE